MPFATFIPCREFGEQRTFNSLFFYSFNFFNSFNFYLSFATFIPCRELGEQRIALGLQPKKTLNLHFKTKLCKFKISESLIFILFFMFYKEKQVRSRMDNMLWNHHACITYCKLYWCLILHLHKIMVISAPFFYNPKHNITFIL